ncbi:MULTISPECIES: hypothetical protein [Paenibacillus]|uniref:hypothetical protein n=1 Tax=Paenibacillus TaxID=44249 RepID=UPI0022B8D343|nr:hypothetical protein [Paenibacillus caseinilyticus]MCZ8521805.1 hypothetical protein [Paenibacillus caseinilyticus]
MNSGQMMVIIEHGSGQGQRIEVHAGPAGAGPRGSGTLGTVSDEARIITPKDVESCIRQAIPLGWNPQGKGKPLSFALRGDLLTLR